MGSNAYAQVVACMPTRESRGECLASTTICTCLLARKKENLRGKCVLTNNNMQVVACMSKRESGRTCLASNDYVQTVAGTSKIESCGQVSGAQ